MVTPENGPLLALMRKRFPGLSVDGVGDYAEALTAVATGTAAAAGLNKQAGAIMGAGITVTGMLGMSGVFMLSSPTPNATIDTLTLLVPQGWANRMLISIMEGLSPERALFSLLGLLVYSAVMAVFGFIRFQKRFA